MENFSDYTIYQKEYIEAIRESYQKPIIDMVDNKNNFIHPTAIIGANVVLGKNNYIGANCYIVGSVIIGDNNHFEAFCSVGTFPEHRSLFNSKKMKGVEIGDDNVFREFTTINSGCYRNTFLASNIWMLRGSHVGHDAEIYDDTTLSCNVIIGGHSSIGCDVNFGIGAICHQFSVIGSGSMIGMGAIVTKTSEVKPLETHVGNPCKYLKDNTYKKDKLSNEDILSYERFYEKQLNEMNNLKKSL